MKIPGTISLFFVRNHLFVAICAASLCYQTTVRLGHPETFLSTLMIFFGTLVMYNIHRIYRNNTMLRVRVRLDTYTLMAISIVIGIILLIQLPTGSIVILLACSFGTLLYTFRSFKIRGRRKSLRHLPYVKSLFISLIWTVLTVWLPFSQTEGGNEELWPLTVERLLFVFSITIPFDIRDMTQDATEGIITIPHKIGITDTRIMSIFISVLFAALVSARWILNELETGTFIALIGSFAFTVAVISKVGEKSPYKYYGIYLEGMSLVQSLLVILALCIF